MNQEQTEQLIANAAYEACVNDAMHKRCMQIYSPLAELYNKYSGKIPKKNVEQIQKKNYGKHMHDLEPILGVYKAYYSDEKLCDNKLYEAIETQLRTLLKSAITLARPCGEYFTPQTEALVHEEVEKTLVVFQYNIRFYLEKKGTFPVPEDKVAEIIYDELMSNLILLPEDIEKKRELDIMSIEGKTRFFDEFIDAAKEVFGSHLDDTLMFASSIVARTESTNGFNEVRNRARYMGKRIEESNHPSFAAVSNVLSDKGRMEKLGERLGKIDTNDLSSLSTYRPYEDSDVVIRIFTNCDSKLEVMMVERFSELLYEYELENVKLGDIINTVNGIKTKDVVKYAKIAYSISYEKDINPDTENGMMAYVDELVNLIGYHIILKENELIIKELSHAPSDSKKATGRQRDDSQITLFETIEELEKKNDDLQAKYEKLEKEKARSEKMLNSYIHECENEIKRLTEKYEPEEPDDDQEDEEEVEEASAPEPQETMTKEEFLEFIRTHKILCWGARPSVLRKFSAIFTDMDFLPSDKKLTNTMVSKYDGVLMKADYTGHSEYYTIRDMLRNLGIPMICLDNNWNSEKRFYEAGYRLSKLI